MSPIMKARQILKRQMASASTSTLFARFAAYDVKDRQVATGNGASCRDNNIILKLKPGTKLCRALLNW